MFIRFSNQEDINTYQPTAVNTAGTQRLADGSKIVGAVRGRDAILCLDRYIFIYYEIYWSTIYIWFSTSRNKLWIDWTERCIEVDGAAYWFSENGFFKYSGNLETMICLVEDFVYDDLNTTANQLINVGLNNLFGEITWFYCTESSTVINRCVLIIIWTQHHKDLYGLQEL